MMRYMTITDHKGHIVDLQHMLTAGPSQITQGKGLVPTNIDQVKEWASTFNIVAMRYQVTLGFDQLTDYAGQYVNALREDIIPSTFNQSYTLSNEDGYCTLQTSDNIPDYNVEEKFPKENFRVNREMREKFLVYDPFLTKF